MASKKKAAGFTKGGKPVRMPKVSTNPGSRGTKKTAGQKIKPTSARKQAANKSAKGRIAKATPAVVKARAGGSAAARRQSAGKLMKAARLPGGRKSAPKAKASTAKGRGH